MKVTIQLHETKDKILDTLDMEYRGFIPRVGESLNIEGTKYRVVKLVHNMSFSVVDMDNYDPNVIGIDEIVIIAYMEKKKEHVKESEYTKIITQYTSIYNNQYDN